MSQVLHLEASKQRTEVDPAHEKRHALAAQPCHVPGAIVEPAELVDGRGKFGEMCAKNVHV
jgi:hypothetical protein